MKKLIKLGIVLLFLAWGTESFAQIFGVKGGLNLANMLAKDEEETYSDDFKMHPGFHVGPTIEFPISDMFSFESGMLLSTKGMQAKEEESYMDELYKYEEKLNLYYLDIPLTSKVYFDMGGSKIYGTFGPYLGIGISGKAKVETAMYGDTEKDEEDIDFGSDEEEDELKRLDYGLTAGAGIAFNAIEIGISYNFGLANIATNTEAENKICNRVLGISIGYKFGKKSNQGF